MAFYTHDGVRHEDKKAAIEYLETHFVSEVPPFEDNLYTSLHNHGWGKFDIQAIPDDTHENSMYLELFEGVFDVENIYRGFNQVTYSSLGVEEEADSLIEQLDKHARFISMLGNEIRESLVNIKDNDDYFYDEETPVVTLNYTIIKEIYEVGEVAEIEETHKVDYNVDNIFSGEVVLKAGEDAVQKVIDDVLEHMYWEISGEFAPQEGTIGKKKIDYMLDAAMKTGREVTMSLSRDKGIAEGV